MKRAILIGTVVLVGGASALLSLTRQESFPHARHQGLFPTCTACHEGIETGDASQFVSVQPATCQACHDGQTAPQVSWNGPGERVATSRRSVHPGHPQLPCETCHRAPGATGEMQVQAAAFDNCKVCHEPEAVDHRADDNNCYQCHVPLTKATGLTTTQIAAFPKPPSHSSPEFISSHGATANEDVMSCSVCHARESCTMCHVNAEHVPAIMALGHDTRVASMTEGKTWDPPVPGSHYVTDWNFAHGSAMAESPNSCATCHTQEVCSTCHVDTYKSIAKDFTTASAASPEDLSITIPGHSQNFAVAHGQAAVAATPRCAACHDERYCVDCHDGSGRPSFHPVDFVQRHGAEVAAQLQTCSECHSNEVFCRDCHSTQGFAVGVQTGAVFHDAVPDWFLAHGQAARQGLDGCASCHSQTSCLRCHSAVEGFRINPHGPDFDADAEMAKGSCTICHGSAPGGESP
jgi:hypothetical protein